MARGNNTLKNNLRLARVLHQVTRNVNDMSVEGKKIFVISTDENGLHISTEEKKTDQSLKDR